MGKLVLAAKITHVPSMYLSEQDGPHKGCRQAAIDGHKEIARRMRELVRRTNNEVLEAVARVERVLGVALRRPLRG